MTPAQLQELKDHVATTIQEKVNGKIDRIDTKIDEYIKGDLKWKETVDTFVTEMAPVKDGVHALQLVNKFVKWLGFPAIGAILVYLFMK